MRQRKVERRTSVREIHSNTTVRAVMATVRADASQKFYSVTRTVQSAWALCSWRRSYLVRKRR